HFLVSDTVSGNTTGIRAGASVYMQLNDVFNNVENGVEILAENSTLGDPDFGGLNGLFCNGASDLFVALPPGGTVTAEADLWDHNPPRSSSPSSASGCAGSDICFEASVTVDTMGAELAGPPRRPTLRRCP